uniref:Uncharacterized protein n=1 Tax=Anguilla anguilla TaxID=7936 RepID=A0A0E9P8A9_ANGAN
MRKTRAGCTINLVHKEANLEIWLQSNEEEVLNGVAIRDGGTSYILGTAVITMQRCMKYIYS